MERNGRIFVAGHRGLVGSAIVRRLKKEGHTNLVLRTRQELELLDQTAVQKFFKDERIEYVFHAAGRVGGIHYNQTYPADFLYENLTIATNVMHAAAEAKVEKLLYLGSSCIYPRMAPQPIREESLLSGPLEPTNEGYAVAKIAGLKLCEMYQRQYKKRFISVMPTNLYGPFDNYHPLHSHVIPGMMRRFHEAKVSKSKNVSIWGSGYPKREFLYVDDLAEALLILMDRYEEPKPINVGTGKDCTIRELAETMKEVTEFPGELIFDASKPDGTPRKVLDTTRIQALGWQPRHSLREGLVQSYHWAVEQDVFSE